ncbi:MAG: S8 family serine peptidase, partial [Bacteroidota bacterium]
MTNTISGNTYGRLGMWDEGAVRRSHIEFNGGDNRVVQRDGSQSISSHATHIAGTMVAEGDNTFARGMASRAQLEANDWYADDSEMALAAANGLLISNHSYGTLSGWVAIGSEWIWYGDKNVSLEEDYKFGFYDQRSALWDQISYNAPYYLIVKSAGNDRGEGPGASPVNAESDGGADGYDCIATFGNAKNVLTVGAVFGLDQPYSDPQDVVMTSFSAWGPTDDGRIKPDLCANGVAVFSPTSFTNDSYQNLNGTSMATASVSASLLLLQEHYQNLNGDESFMLSASLKALAIHTADEAGLHEGPDYQFGWGLMNSARAAQLISQDRAFNNSLIKEEELTQGQVYTY